MSGMGHETHSYRPNSSTNNTGHGSKICKDCYRVFSEEIFIVPESEQTLSDNLHPRHGPVVGDNPQDAWICFISHKNNRGELEVSAESCSCCAWLMQVGLKDWWPQCIAAWQSSASLGFWILRQRFGISTCVADYKPRGYRPEYHEDLPFFNLTNTHGTFEIVAAHGTPAASEVCRRLTATDKDLSHVRFWLNDCLHNHPNHTHIKTRCARRPPIHSALTLDSPLPTRILDLTRLHDAQELRLIETRGKRGQYASLTWCWGKQPHKVLKTTKESLSQRLKRIGMEELPPLFQDVARVCYDLHIPFLWIDALCIIQDDICDWHNEAEQMGQVYANAFLTISAGGAHSPDERLFQNSARSVRSLPFFAMPFHRGGLVYLQKTRQRKQLVRGQDIECGPVSERAWCLQERYLSQRILHFTGEWSEWECLSTTQHETRHMTLPYDGHHPLVRPHGLKLNAGPRRNDAPTLARYPYDMWYAGVEEYNNRQMTFDKDRLPGILGVADQFAQLHGLRRDRDLVCGVWSSDLIPGLMWTHGVGPHRPSSERTASWSWLSNVGKKEWDHGFNSENIAVTVARKPDADNHTIMLEGRLVKITSLHGHWVILKEMDAGEDKEDHICYNHEEGEREKEIDIFSRYPEFDFPSEYTNDLESLFVLPVVMPVSLTTAGARHGWALLLTKTDRASHYERLGWAELTNLSGEYYEKSCEDFWRKQDLFTIELV